MAAMLRPNRNCCWVGQPDPTAWKKPIGEGCVGWARKPKKYDMRTCKFNDRKIDAMLIGGLGLTDPGVAQQIWLRAPFWAPAVFRPF